MHTRIMFRGERIKELREARGLRQGELASAAHTTQATVSRIEGGGASKRPDRALAQRIARALNVALAEVFEDQTLDPEERAPDAPMPEGDALEAALLRAVEPGRHRVEDLEAALRALIEARRLTGAAIDAEAVASTWLDAAAHLRASGSTPTPSAIAAFIALRGASGAA